MTYGLGLEFYGEHNGDVHFCVSLRKQKLQHVFSVQVMQNVYLYTTNVITCVLFCSVMRLIFMCVVRSISRIIAIGQTQILTG